ncbi:molybdopterin-dependent oxidoreductase [Janibacter cremeus]|uniref:DMSO/TMAO reductase YedYZ molybdopterin-dependent catalytic subunit n=1 Tax=Janibacter cremeus TaxID=1285192 RepID=A0A852VQF6_9MICO|nr:molybdopterin-dependent oxidoreductase [Janibacter cremeus]NYF98436.1 DMSO/TMAO reductase YedYZ molybdopterin-dependent catalytic subunit [Janibacter cremeus]
MSRSRSYAALGGAVSVGAGLAVAEFASGVAELGASPVLAAGEAVIALTPGGLSEAAIQLVGTADKPLLVLGTVLIALLVGAIAGVLALTRLGRGVALLAALGAVAAWAVIASEDGGVADTIPSVLGVCVAAAALSLLTRRVPHTDRVTSGGADRRRFLLLAGATAMGAAAVTLAGRALGEGRRVVEEARRTLRLPIKEPEVPTEVAVDVKGIGPWQTPNEDFYRIDTALGAPEVTPQDWRLRIHGLVEREIEIGYDELVDLGLENTWLTIACVSNPVGGPLIGNAWWSGVPIADLLARAGVAPEADAVLQTSVDGWTCGTPLRALTDQRGSLLAVAMNGEPLPVEHGFPVRMVVPGLYGYVSATKWLVDLEVTRFDRISAYWTEHGWGELGPIKTQSRIEVPAGGATVPAGRVGVGGVAWDQHVGIDRVEVRVDDGPWQDARLADVPNVDTWRQWAWTWDAEPGEHRLTVRATNAEGETQTSERQGVLPDGATGWHTVAVDVA